MRESVATTAGMLPLCHAMPRSSCIARLQYEQEISEMRQHGEKEDLCWSGF